jgi:hypothetical protein
MISEQGLHTQASSASPNNKDTSTQFSTGFSFRECAHGISRRQTQTPRSLDRGVHGFLTTNTGFLFCVRITPGSLADWLPFSPSGQSDRMDQNPPHGLLRLFYLHAPGSTLVTLGTACVPSVRLPPTTWEITCPSKGLRIK